MLPQRREGSKFKLGRNGDVECRTFSQIAHNGDRSLMRFYDLVDIVQTESEAFCVVQVSLFHTVKFVE